MILPSGGTLMILKYFPSATDTSGNVFKKLLLLIFPELRDWMITVFQNYAPYRKISAPKFSN